MHELRKDLKKLRYVLEILPPSRKKKGHEAKLAGLVRARSPVAARLKELQDLIGSIHDCDIAIDYLETASGTAAAIRHKEIAERDALFEKFVKMYVNDLTIDMGQEGKNSIIALLQNAKRKNILSYDDLLFIDSNGKKIQSYR